MCVPGVCYLFQPMVMSGRGRCSAEHDRRTNQKHQVSNFCLWGGRETEKDSARANTNKMIKQSFCKICSDVSKIVIVINSTPI